MRRKIQVDQESIVRTMKAEVHGAEGHMTLAKFCQRIAYLAGLSKHLNNPSQSRTVREILEAVTKDAELKLVELRRGKRTMSFIALQEMDVETIKAAKGNYTPRGRKRVAGGKMRARKQRRRARVNSGGVLEVMMRVCSVLKHQGKRRQKAIAQVAEQMARIEARLVSCEEEMQKLRAGISMSGDGADGAYLKRAQRKVLAMLDQIEQEEA